MDYHNSLLVFLCVFFYTDYHNSLLVFYVCVFYCLKKKVLSVFNVSNACNANSMKGHSDTHNHV